MSKDATAAQVRKFFEYESVKEFMADWKALDKEEQAYFKSAVGEEINE